MNKQTKFLLVSMLFCSMGLSGMLKPRTTFKKPHYVCQNVPEICQKVSKKSKRELREEERQRAEAEFFERVSSSVHESVMALLKQENQENAKRMQLTLEKSQEKALKAFEKQQNSMLSALKVEQEKRLKTFDQCCLALKLQQSSMETSLACASPKSAAVPVVVAPTAHMKPKAKNEEVASAQPAATVSKKGEEKAEAMPAPCAMTDMESKKATPEAAPVCS